jgi:2-polyprenyl-3-methyl-5-hydroxy-6-metoxy-1,4-benzoquinol methylase
MYDMLKSLATRPDPYSSMTVKDLWTRPHIARQMLAYHLDQGTSLASRPVAEIEESVGWLDGQLDLKSKRVCDLGCGPGLYSSRLARRGAMVTGVDFSRVAIAHAESQIATNDPGIDYLVADYLTDNLPRGFDVIMLIYYDYCVLPPETRRELLGRIHSMLNPGGKLVLDVVTDVAFQQAGEQLAIEERLMGGFWSDSDYVGIHRTWLYQDSMLSLDHYVIVEPAGHWEILNWMQYFSSNRLVQELEEAGFAIRSLTGSLTGEVLTNAGRELAVIAEAGPTG